VLRWVRHVRKGVENDHSRTWFVCKNNIPRAVSIAMDRRRLKGRVASRFRSTFKAPLPMNLSGSGEGETRKERTSSKHERNRVTDRQEALKDIRKADKNERSSYSVTRHILGGSKQAPMNCRILWQRSMDMTPIS
jgi:hypothetical protein